MGNFLLIKTDITDIFGLVVGVKGEVFFTTEEVYDVELFATGVGGGGLGGFGG
jgi:hypothetical protein